MKTIEIIATMRAESERLRRSGKRIGLVPTMGYLHEGHLSLVRIAKSKSDVVVVSIFVNPMQFGPNEDFQRYPRDLARDEKLAGQAGADILFHPSTEEMYPEGYLTFVNVEKITEGLCGASRPGHFRGVATVCTKLFLAVKPHVAVFGRKDAQQVAVIKRMVRDLNMDLEIIAAPIVREPDGLAMSSRNAYLSPGERRDALCLHQSLRLAEALYQQGERNPTAFETVMRRAIEEKKNARIEYIEIVHPDTLEPLDEIRDRALVALAVRIGGTRLIDNTVLG